jgi:hypothetical protein
MSNQQPNIHTILATSGRGDVTFPFTPTTMDGMTIGQYIPPDATLSSVVVNDTAVLNGAVSGDGFVSSVEALISQSGYDPSAVAITGGTIDGTSIGATTRSTVSATTVNANSTVTGTQLISTVAIGTAPFSVTSTTPVANLSIGGNAATSTSATTATNVAGGAAGSIPYQTGSGATSMLSQASGVLVGGATPSYSTAPTLTGTNFSGTAGSLSIGGNAATATTATTATNISGGANGSVPYQTGSGATAMLAAATDGQVLTLSSGVPTWANAPGLNQNAQTSSYTAVLSDAQKQIYFSGSTGSQTLTIPANASVAYPIGTALTFINMASVSVGIAITSDTLYWSPSGTTGSRTLAQYGLATAIKLTSTTWIISGQGLT